jgi:hypothetical protein
MSNKLTIAERLAAIAEEVRRIEAVKSWRALKQRGLSAKATKRSGDGAGEAKIGRMFAGSLWLISRRRFLQHHGSHRPSLVHRGLTMLKALRGLR